MSKAVVIQPWKKTCPLRTEIRERELKEEDFAVDLSAIVNRSASGAGLFFCDPEKFFKITYATENLRRFCSGIMGRLAGRRDGVSLINVAQTFGGGKTHALATAYYLCSLGSKVPKHHPAVKEILAAAKMTDAPVARIAAVSFDKVDWKDGGLVRSPVGEQRKFRMPWNLIAWQLLGQKGIDILKRNEDEPDFYEPPAQPLWDELLAAVEADGLGALILLDEFLMWAHGAASPDVDPTRQDKGPVWFDRLRNFFQTLAKATADSKRSCLVVSLLATDPAKRDETGAEILARCNAGLNRQADMQTPVDKGDFSELLRRWMFEDYPKGAAGCDQYVTAFWHRMVAAEPARAKTPDAKKEMMDSYPFHPDLLNRLFGKWGELRQFQRTRGILQTFSRALREAEAWDESPIVSAQVFLARPDASDLLSPALEKLANAAMYSVDDTNKPSWPNNLRTELPRARLAQTTAATLMGREVEAACAGAFIFSQPLGEQAELGELRWLIAATCDMPAMLNTGLLEWAKTSWYLSECESTDPASGLPRYWRLGPEPNLNQMHDSFKRDALKHARVKFDDLVKECRPLRDGCQEEGVSVHLLPASPDKVEDDATFRLVVLGAAYAGTPGSTPKANALEFLRTHASASDPREFPNVLLVVIPSATGLIQAEQNIAAWMAWGEIRKSDKFKDFKDDQREMVKRRERDAQKDALTFVKNAFELVIYLDPTGNALQKKFTMGGETLFSTLVKERDLRIFRDKINPELLLPGGPISKWPASDPSIKVKSLYCAFGKYPDMPKLLNRQVVIKTVEEAVRRGLVALRYMPPGGEEWFWHSPIEGVVDWADLSEVWLPAKATVNKVHPIAVGPTALAGLWPTDDTPVKLSALCAWFDGAHSFDEIAQAGYAPEKRAIPKADYKIVHQAVAQAVLRGDLWLVFGNESVLGEMPTDLQLDPDAALFRPPTRLRAMDLLPGALPGAWAGAPVMTTVGKLYSELKARKGRPWATKQFIDVLNEAVNQAMLVRGAVGPEYTSVTGDASRELKLPPTGTAKPATTTVVTGAKETTEAAMNLGQLQDFVEDGAPALTKMLAGATPEFAVKIRFKGRVPGNLAAVNEVLKKINPDWTFGA